MAKVTNYYTTLYQREYPDPPGRLLSTHIEPFQINDKVPSEAEAEAEAAVRRFRPHNADVHTHLRAGHFKT